MIDIAQLEPRCDLCCKHVEPEALETVMRFYCRDCAAAHDLDVPLSKAATLSILAELATRQLGEFITPDEKDILDAAKALDCKPVRAIVDDRPDSEDPGQSMPAPTGMMTLGGRGQIRKVCEAVIRWRKTQEET